MLVAGLFLAALAVPSGLSDWSDGRAPRRGLGLAAVGAGLVAAAVWLKPGGYALAQVPDTVVTVLARLVN